MSDRFRSAIAYAVQVHETTNRDECTHLADAILAMPEMQELRGAVNRWITHCVWTAPADTPMSDIRERIGPLSEAVIEWVLSSTEVSGD
jgi:hypothetical protein